MQTSGCSSAASASRLRTANPTRKRSGGAPTLPKSLKVEQRGAIAILTLARPEKRNALNDTTALWCWISGMELDGKNADGTIDYAHCDTSAMPMPTRQNGAAATFSSVYANILQPACSSCHRSGTSAACKPDDYEIAAERGFGRSVVAIRVQACTASPTSSTKFLNVPIRARSRFTNRPNTN